MDYVAQLHLSIFREVYRILGLDAEKTTVELITAVISLLLVLLIAWLANFMVKGFVLGVVRSLAKKSKTRSWRAFPQGEILSPSVPSCSRFHVISALSPILLGAL